MTKSMHTRLTVNRNSKIEERMTKREVDAIRAMVRSLKVGDRVRIVEMNTDRFTKRRAKKRDCSYEHHEGELAGKYPSFLSIKTKTGYCISVEYRNLIAGAIKVFPVSEGVD